MKYCKYLRDLNTNSNDIGVEGAAVLVSRWQYKSMLRLNLDNCFDDSHDSALRNESPCSSCDHLLEQYFNNDYVTTPGIPKLVSTNY